MLDTLTVQRMEALAGEGPILIALSGGGDSVALLYSMVEHLGATRLRACVIDHALRNEARRDAERAAACAAAVGVAATIETLTWPRANRAHEAARRLRYAALCGQARRLGARVIAAGHTRDDQAETVLLRASRGSGLRGLAGMRALAPAPIWPEGRGLWLARPLLGVRRSELRGYLRARNAHWIEDPANENEIYARVRARRALAMFEREGVNPMRLAALAERLQPHADAIDRQAAALISEAAAFDEGEIALDLDRWLGSDAVTQRALSAVVAAASGAEREPAMTQLRTLSAAMNCPGFSGATLAGAWLRPRSGRIAVRRDPGGLLGRAGGAAAFPPFPLMPNEEATWDGRVALSIAEPGWSVVFDGRTAALQRGAERRSLAAATPHWLLKEHLQHLLGMH